MKVRGFIVLITFLCVGSLIGQHQIAIDATLLSEEKTINIEQEIIYVNTSNVSLDEIYLHDWANSFSEKTTPLAKRFGENYDSSFHFEKDEDRGRTVVHGMFDEAQQPLIWNRGEELDIIKITLNTPLLPGQRVTLKLLYDVVVPDDKFTRYGVSRENNYRLQYWYISPAVFDGEWQIYSNKNTEDLYTNPSDFSITFRAPAQYQLTSDFDVLSTQSNNDTTTTKLSGKSRMSSILYLEQNNSFESIVTDKVEIITNIKDKQVTPAIKALSVDRITYFLDEKLGDYPFNKIVISEANYKRRPVYGLNQLPNFISPFPDGFEYDIQQLKTITRLYIENTFSLHPRNDYWLMGAIQIHLMMEYVDRYYPKMKIIGNLSNFWIIRWSHISDMEFNDQYPMLYLNMARNNLHQSLVTPKDSLVKFNKNIASDYYGGDGLQYLSDYLGEEVVDQSIKQFYSENLLKPTHSREFESILEKSTDLPVNWFFDEYVGKRTTIDFKIQKVEKLGDSLRVYVKNLQKNNMPVSIYGINKDSIVYKKWIAPIDSVSTVVVPAEGIKRLALNYEGIIPEYNQRNNYKKVTTLLNRPVQFRLFQDVEDPKFNQLFFIPVFEYNIYDGFSVGPKLYNKTLLPKGFHYKIEPQYGFRSKTIIGKGSLSYTKNLNNDNFYRMRYGISGSLFSYDEGLFYKRVTPFVTFSFRNKDLRHNEKQFINIRSVNVFQDLDPTDPEQEPNYSVFNAQYVYANPNLINYFRGSFDYQLSSDFSKIFTTLEYRKLFLSNRQLNVRFFAGAFLYNNTSENGDFFSFALDRPSDYLFDYRYYGRSEDDGLFSQQLIIAEGGFKSQLEPATANSWMTTVNASTNIWKWIYAYGDAGLVHNRGQGTKAVFDTGIRVNLVTDYFELYFPLYSNLGWEPGLPDYDQKIRFIVSISTGTLLRLFTREWY